MKNSQDLEFIPRLQHLPDTVAMPELSTDPLSLSLSPVMPPCPRDPTGSGQLRWGTGSPAVSQLLSPASEAHMIQPHL